MMEDCRLGAGFFGMEGYCDLILCLDCKREGTRVVRRRYEGVTVFGNWFLRDPLE